MDDFKRLAELTGPKLRKLSRQKRLIRHCFKAFREKVYPGAPPDQIRELKVSFYAGAAELFNVMLAGYELDGTDEPTETDMDYIAGISEELDDFYRKVVAEAEMLDRTQPRN